MVPEQKKITTDTISQTLAEIANSAEKELKKNTTLPGLGKSPFEEKKESVYTPNPALKTLRTFQGDMEETIHRKNESVVSIAVAEQNPRKKEAPDTLIPERSNIFLTYGILPLAGFILIVTGIITLGAIYSYKAFNNAPVDITPQTTLINSFEKKDILLNTSEKEAIFQTLTSNKNSFNKPVGSVLYTRFLKNNTELSVEEFFQTIAPSAPSTLTRSFSGPYMSGVYSFDTNEVFLILSSADYGQTYAGMLKWENTLFADLYPLFSSIQTLQTEKYIFQDDSYNNRDIRLLRDENGKILLVYGFIDKNILIITANEKIFQSVASKYTNSKLVR